MSSNPITQAVRERHAQERREKVAALARHLAQLPQAKAIREVLRAPAGRELMRFLEEEFLFGDLQGDDPYQTAFNLGAREVVCHLRFFRDLNEKAERTGE